MMTCTACGRSQETNAHYCSSCGTALLGAAPYAEMVRRQPGRLVRPRENRMVAGVCAGFALAYGWDLAIVRLVVALSILFAGVPLIAYLVAWVVMPNAQYTLPAQAGAGPGSMAL